MCQTVSVDRSDNIVVVVDVAGTWGLLDLTELVPLVRVFVVGPLSCCGPQQLLWNTAGAGGRTCEVYQYYCEVRT